MKKALLFLAIILLCVLFMACSSNNNENPVDFQSPEPNGISDAESGSVNERIKPDVPEADYDGYEFAILCNSPDYNAHWYSRDIYVESETGDTIDDAVYYRNRAIEEKYNVKIKGIFSTSQANDARRSINAGDNPYDVFSIPVQGVLANLAQEGLLLDLKTMPYIDLEKPWWDQRANKQLSINHKLMYTISDLLVIDKDALTIFLSCLST